MHQGRSTIGKSIFPNDEKSGRRSSHQSRSTAFPMIQSMEAKLYFDDVEGFVEWSILLSIGVQRGLRDVKRADITISYAAL